MEKKGPYKKYSGEFKQEVIETMAREKLSYSEAARRFDVSHHHLIALWERVYREKGAEGLYVDRRGGSRKKSSTAKTVKPEGEEDLLAEVQRLRAENAYLKKLNALVAERVRQERNQK